ncbi:hypothetical protein EJ06DRAFT_88893 [Trichodelitschia bisporula]|uniref:Uncharacterized protein n=1 Tax=Trichodelitschia bisporula TaxID=703511 RepID=A0A6G1HS80_9PEZI|nr:hypothetical protein EJ06DRAFT_88893 [Trichodelitschia bisporula]
MLGGKGALARLTPRAIRSPLRTHYNYHHVPQLVRPRPVGTPARTHHRGARNRRHRQPGQRHCLHPPLHPSPRARHPFLRSPHPQPPNLHHHHPSLTRHAPPQAVPSSTSAQKVHLLRLDPKRSHRPRRTLPTSRDRKTHPRTKQTPHKPVRGLGRGRCGARVANHVHIIHS